MLSKVPSNCSYSGWGLSLSGLLAISWVPTATASPPSLRQTWEIIFWQDTLGRDSTCPALRAREGGQRRSSGRPSGARDGAATGKGRNGSTLAFKLRARKMGWIRRSTQRAAGPRWWKPASPRRPLRRPPPSQPGGAGPRGAQPVSAAPAALAPPGPSSAVRGARPGRPGSAGRRPLRSQRERPPRSTSLNSESAPQAARGPSTPALRLLLH